MKKRTDGAVTAIVVGGLLASVAMSGRAMADTHYVVVTNLANGTQDEAFVLASTDPSTGSIPFVLVKVFDPSLPVPVEYLLWPDAKGFARSANLIGANAPDTLVSISSTEEMGATLRQRDSNARVVLSVPAGSGVLGQVFNVSHGGPGTSFLLVGNPNAGPANVVARFGDINIPDAILHLDSERAGRIELPASETFVQVTADVPVIVELAVDTGKVDVSFVAPR